MSNLKQLKLRIAGVKSTQKITKAMKMVAAAKLLKSQNQKDLAKNYAKNMQSMLNNIALSAKQNNDTAPLLTGTGKSDSHLLVIMSSDRGLCGAFNSSILKKAKLIIKDYITKGYDYKILCIGKKSYEHLKLLHENKVIEVIPGFSNKKFSYSQAVEIASKVTDLFEKSEFDVCTVLYNEFQNAMKQNVMTRQLIPLSCNELGVNDQQIYEYEPRQEKILDKILPLNLAVQLYYIILESIVSEHGARMTSMDSATNNANEMIGNLTLLYNRSRQAAITKELIEIVSSAEAL